MEVEKGTVREIYFLKIAESKWGGYNYTLCFITQDFALDFLKQHNYDTETREGSSEKIVNYGGDVTLRGVNCFLLGRFLNTKTGGCAYLEKLIFCKS